MRRINRLDEEKYLSTPIVSTPYNSLSYIDYLRENAFDPKFYMGTSGQIALPIGVWNNRVGIQSLTPRSLRFRECGILGLFAPTHDADFLTTLENDLYSLRRNLSLKLSGYLLTQPIIGKEGLLNNYLEVLNIFNKTSHQRVKKYQIIKELQNIERNFLVTSDCIESKDSILIDQYFESREISIDTIEEFSATRRNLFRKSLKTKPYVKVIVPRNLKESQDEYSKAKFLFLETRNRRGGGSESWENSPANTEAIISGGSTFIFLHMGEDERVSDSILVLVLNHKTAVIHHHASNSKALVQNYSSVLYFLAFSICTKLGIKFVAVGHDHDRKNQEISSLNSFKLSLGVTSFEIPQFFIK